MTTYKVRVPRHRLPFFTLWDGCMYVDLLWNHGDPLELDLEHVAALLATVRPGDLVLGRKLSGREQADTLAKLSDASGENVGFLNLNLYSPRAR